MSSTRRRRDEQTGLNRAQLLAAARDVFLDRGFHAASLDQIAERAGFSKGVVYSQFASKADLFLSLLEERIEARAAQNAAIAADLEGIDDVATLARVWATIQRADESWTLLVLEFRLHAARHAELNERYARAHARTIDGLAELLSSLYRRAGTEPPDDVRTLATAVLALGNGATLEEAVHPDTLPVDTAARLVSRLLGARADAPRVVAG
jgi:AcrR family transcriptional regulator